MNIARKPKYVYIQASLFIDNCFNAYEVEFYSTFISNLGSKYHLTQKLCLCNSFVT